MKKHLMFWLIFLIFVPYYCLASEGKQNFNVSSHKTAFTRDALYANQIHDSTSMRHLHYSNKSPTAAFVIGFVPGFFVHGLGHFYAGKRTAGGWLLASEGASLLLMYGAVTGLAAHMDCPECNNTGINLMAYSGLFLFFGGWIIDFGDAPNQIIKDKNRAISGNGLSFSTNKKTVFLKFTINLK